MVRGELSACNQPLTFQHPFLFLHLWTKQYPSLWLSSAHPDLATFLYKYHYPETNLPPGFLLPVLRLVCSRLSHRSLSCPALQGGPALPCPALQGGPALPSPALQGGPALPCPALPCPALPCHALPCPAGRPCPALPCRAALPCPALPCPAGRPCPALPCPAGRPCPALPCPALPCPAGRPCPALPCPALLLAAGDKLGKVGLWNLGADWGDDGVLLFEPHTRPVGCMAFSTVHPSQLLTLSYDGSLRCMDVEKAVFDDVYNISDGLKTFAFLSHDCSTLVVGNWFGEVAIVDRRTPGNSHESIHPIDPKTLRCVSVHPLQMQYFAVAESRVVGIYDSRRLKKTKSEPVSQLTGHTLSITSAYFSPSTGNRVLTTCMDNHIRIYDTSLVSSNAPLLKSVRHDMQTGRWLSKLSAVWDPKQEDCFVVGSMMRPRRVQVFHESGKHLHTFTDEENLNTVLSVTALHPTRNALLGGNASGRVHVFS
nr:WD repeat-containing protein 76 [Nothobranchius furzeri]